MSPIENSDRATRTRAPTAGGAKRKYLPVLVAMDHAHSDRSRSRFRSSETIDVERLWADPKRFDPSRFESPDPEQQQSLLPFGLGPRSCIGQHLAMAELVALLPLLARRGDITLDHEPQEDAQFALRPRDDLIVRFETPTNATPSHP